MRKIDAVLPFKDNVDGVIYFFNMPKKLEKGGLKA